MSRAPAVTVRFVEVLCADGDSRLVEWVDVMRSEWRAWPFARLYGWRGVGEGWGWMLATADRRRAAEAEAPRC